MVNIIRMLDRLQGTVFFDDSANPAGPVRYRLARMPSGVLSLFRNADEEAFLTGQTPLRVLEMLILAKLDNRMVYNRELYRLWGAAGASKNTLEQHVRKLRSELEDDARHSRIIATISGNDEGSGYRFLLHARHLPDSPTVTEEAPPSLEEYGSSHEQRQGIDISGKPCAPGDLFYIAPPAVKEGIQLLRGALASTPLIVIGPKRSGKTSLLFRLQAEASKISHQLISLNLDLIPREQMSSSEDFLRTFAAMLLAEGAGTQLTEIDWKGIGASASKTTRLVQDRILSLTKRVTIAIDQADRVLESSIAGEFFGMLRTWTNEGAAFGVPGRKWKNCDLILFVSSNPNRFIVDSESSPFNVGTMVHLLPLDVRDVGTMLVSADLPPSWASGLHDLTGGLPYLVRLAIGWLGNRQSEDALGEVFSRALSEVGPFASTLGSLWHDIDVRWPGMQTYLRSMEEGKLCSPKKELEMARFRLVSRGILKPEDRDAYTCELYRRFFHGRFI